MNKYSVLCFTVLAVVGLIAGGVQADLVKFIWSVDSGVPGFPVIPLDNNTLQEGETFAWQGVSIPVQYQAYAVYWQALGASTIAVNTDAIHQDITVVITISLGAELLGQPVALKLQFDVYDGIVPGSSTEGLTPLNAGEEHFLFDRSDGVILYFELSEDFETTFLTPLGLTRAGLTLAFVEEDQFTWEGITVTSTTEDGLVTGLTGEVSRFSTLVIVEESAVTPVAIEPITWAKVKSLHR